MSDFEGMSLRAPIQSKLAELGITQWFDLLCHVPLRYEDESHLTLMNHLSEGQWACCQGQVHSQHISHKPKKTLTVTLSDQNGQLLIRFLHFYPALLTLFAPDQWVRVCGDTRIGPYGLEMVHPKAYRVTPNTPLKETLTPIYPSTKGLSQKNIEDAIGQVLLHPERDTAPNPTHPKLPVLTRWEAFNLIHKPTPDMIVDTFQERTNPAWIRLKFEELLAQQITLRQQQVMRQQHSAPALPTQGGFIQTFLAQLPFQLTQAQERVWLELQKDLARTIPMHRLLQGDVGSGKTVLATLCCLAACQGGYQAALMAPTEILAEQHFKKVVQWLEPLGIKTAWLSGRTKKKQKTHITEQIQNGEVQLIIGTHALIQDQVIFKSLGLVVIDEQHRFGVAQRLAIRSKNSSEEFKPHQLMMSATPIPRTLSQSYLADLDLSTLDELPAGRQPITTKLVAATRRLEMMQRIALNCQQGGQAYWVCPLIEESETLQLQTVLATHQEITQAFPNLVIGLIHGRLKPQEKSSLMEQFSLGHCHVLVATTVIEVGVDVPNANLIVIEHAERMGLAQLHQLRGRVGRGVKPSLCVLLYASPLGDLARQRLAIIHQHSNGFEIAEQDLRLRGPGDFLGLQQSGLPLLRFANPITDTKWIPLAQQVAKQWLQDNPQMALDFAQFWMGQRQQFLTV